MRGLVGVAALGAAVMIVVVAIVVVVAFHHVVEGDVVAAAEAFAVFVPGAAGHLRVTVLLLVGGVGPAVGFEVAACGLHAFMETLALDVAVEV